MKLYPFYFRLDCLTGNLGSLAESAQKIPDTLPFFLVVAAELPPSIPIFCGSGENLGLVHLSLQQTPQHCEPLLNGILERCRRFGTKTAQLQPLSFLTENPETPNPSESTASLLAGKTAAQLAEYFCGRRRVFDLPLLLLGTAFQLRAWQQLAKIPYGETAHYEQQAIACGNARASRAIGMANHDNPLLLLLPCHRVLGKNGKLTGFRPGLAYKQYFLALERHYTAQ